MVFFNFEVPDLFCGSEYEIYLSTNLTSSKGYYIDQNQENDKKVILIFSLTDFDIAIHSYDISQKVFNRGDSVKVQAKIANNGNQEERFNLTVLAKFREDKTPWDEIKEKEPFYPNGFPILLELNAGEIIYWNYTFISEMYGEYLLKLRISTELFSYDYKSGLNKSLDEAWSIKDFDQNPFNNVKSLSFRTSNILFKDDMEWI